MHTNRRRMATNPFDSKLGRAQDALPPRLIPTIAHSTEPLSRRARGHLPQWTLFSGYGSRASRERPRRGGEPPTRANRRAAANWLAATWTREPLGAERLPREESWPPARASPPDSGSRADQRESGPGGRGCLARLWRVWRRTVLGVRAGRRRPARRLPAPGPRPVDANPTGSGSGIAWTAVPREAGHRSPLGEARLDEARGDRGLLAGRRPCGQLETPGRKGSRPEQQATADPGLAESRSAVPQAACP